MRNLKLPLKLEKFRDPIEKSALDYIKIEAEEGHTKLLDSKFGGIPFWPKAMPYPTSAEEPFLLLAQINCQDLPENKLLPNKGLLQFYIPADDMYGEDYVEVVFIENHEGIEHKEDFEFLKQIDPRDNPLHNKEYKLSFTKGVDYVNNGDRRFEDYFGKEFFDFFEDMGDEAEELENLYSETITGGGHKLGGYGFFLNDDPRADDENIKDYILLFQMDSESGIMWGDCGSAQFIINKDDLARRDFSKVIYGWDCF